MFKNLLSAKKGPLSENNDEASTDSDEDVESVKERTKFESFMESLIPGNEQISNNDDTEGTETETESNQPTTSKKANKKYNKSAKQKPKRKPKKTRNSKKTPKSNDDDDATDNETLNDGDDDDDEADDDDTSKLLLCFLYQQNKISCASYDSSKKCLYYLKELAENTKFELTNLIINDINPTTVLTSAKMDPDFIEFLKKKCSRTSTEKDTKNSDEEKEDDDDDDDGEDIFKDDSSDECSNTDTENEESVLKHMKKIEFMLLANNDFNYETSVERIYEMDQLENMPADMNESDKNFYFNFLFDFDSKQVIRTIGGLLKHLDRNNLASDARQTSNPIRYIKPLCLDKILFLDLQAFSSLHIFNEVDYVYAYRKAGPYDNLTRTTLNKKLHLFNITLYGIFLTKMQTKIGISKLRSYLLKPTRDINVLNERHRIVEFFMNIYNQDIAHMLKMALKKCKFVGSIMNRIRTTRIKLNDWKRLLKTTESFLAVCNLARFLNERLNLSQNKKSSLLDDCNKSIAESNLSSLLFDDETSKKKGSRRSSSILTGSARASEYATYSTTNSYKSALSYLISSPPPPPLPQPSPAIHLNASTPIQERTNESSFSLFSSPKFTNILKNKQTESSKSSFSASRLSDESTDGNIFSRICSLRYGPKFEYLINLFETTVDLKESNEVNKCKIYTNISSVLDEKKQIYNQLPEFLSSIAKEELEKYNLNECNVMYIPQIGFLLAIKPQSFFEYKKTSTESVASSSAGHYMNSDSPTSVEKEELDKIRAEFEFINELDFVFKSNKQYHYKNARMKEMDEHFGDIACDINDLEAEIMDTLRDEFVKYSHYYAIMIDLCAELDTLLAFATVAKENNFVKPKYHLKQNEISDNEQNNACSFIMVKDGRHPLAEMIVDNSIFVPNDIFSGESNLYNQKLSAEKKTKIKVITAPNASGKTIYLKQVGLIVYMCFIGSFVPASEVIVGDFDRIFTRINSAENVNQGKSSFSMDVQQIADALNGSTSKSLVLIDEFGKGTMPSNGQAILAAIINHWIKMSNFTSPHVFISTHFYEMFKEADFLFKENAFKIEYLTFEYLFVDEKTQKQISAQNEQDDYEIYKKKIIFLHKLKNGITRSSYAINVAKRCGLPKEIIDRATFLFKLFNENMDTDPEVLNGTKPPESKLHLLQPPGTEEMIERAKHVAKKVLELKMEMDKTILEDKDDEFDDPENVANYKFRKYSELLAYLRKLMESRMDPPAESNTKAKPKE